MKTGSLIQQKNSKQELWLDYVNLRPSKGGSLVALSHPFVYLCRLTSGGNCRCRFSVQIHMSLSLQEFVSDVSLQ